MRFEPTAIDGAFVIVTEPNADARGSFARTFCQSEFAAARLDFSPVQVNLSRNPHAGTLRGMHLQAAPHGEAKLIQCVRGRVIDVGIDLRLDSVTFKTHVAVELDSDGDRLLFLPEGCAHGFLTLADDSDLIYYMGSPYVAGAATGVRWDDPSFGIPWPSRPRLISDRDAGYTDWRP